MTHRILGLDLGSKRIGIAISDPLNWTAQPLPMHHFSTVQALASHILNLIDHFEIRSIVAGLPLNMNGSEGPAARNVRLIADELSRIVSIEVNFWDERLSTRSAERTLIEANMRRKERKNHVDSLAAVIILQGYLDRLNLSAEIPG